MTYPLIWYWRKQPFPGRVVDRKGQPCRVVARGALNSVMVEFPDGFWVITSRYAVRNPDPDQPRKPSTGDLFAPQPAQQGRATPFSRGRLKLLDAPSV